MTLPTTPLPFKLIALLALIALFLVGSARPSLGAEIDDICAHRKDAHCVSVPPMKDLANLESFIDCDLPKNFLATDNNPNGARAALPDDSKGRFAAQCKGDPVQQQFDFTFSNAKGSTLKAYPTNTPPKDAKTTVRFSDNSGRDPEPGATLTSHGVGVGLIWTCRK